MTEEQKKYNDARDDVLKAIKSVNELTFQQQEQLFKELMAIGNMQILYNRLTQQHWNGGF